LLEGQAAPGLPFLRQLHWIITPDPASEKDVARIFEAAAGRGSSPDALWRYTSPYRGLEAMEEKDSDYFFGRTEKTVEALNALATPDRMPVLMGSSGVGKSSLAQAGVLAALKRQSWPEQAQAGNTWPAVFRDSRRWCYLSLKPGTDPLKALVGSFVDTWQFAATDPLRADHQHGWVERLRDGEATLSDLLDATERRRAELDQPKPPGFVLYVDQGEELYVRAEERQRRRFSELLLTALADPRLRPMMSMRSDFLGELQKDEALFRARQQIDVPPLREAELREVVSRPAKMLGARFEPDSLVDIITRRTTEDSIKDVGALPLLSYTLDDMWREMVHHGDGLLRLPAQSFDPGGVLVDRANRFVAEHPGKENVLRRIFTLNLATVREDGEPTRRRALRSEFSDEEWRLISELADNPNRLLVTATPEAGETYAEVAHEAIFRRWDKLREWIDGEREFLAWRSGLEATRRSWQAVPDASKRDALLMGLPLAQARSWLAKRSGDISEADRAFIMQSRKAARRRTLGMQALVGIFVAAIVAGFAAWWQQDWLKERIYALSNVTALKTAQEHALKAGDSFKECTDCPEMIVVPAGHFTMGSLRDEKDRFPTEHPQHQVTIAKPFAASKFELTFDEWDTCAAHGDCDPHVSDSEWGRHRQPVINVSWDDAQRYVAWLSRITGKRYRLLSEAEYEYAARAGTQTAYPWGDDIKLNGKAMANCKGCGSQWDAKQTAPVGSFPPNAFGLYDMVGNVWEWTEDCFNGSYKGAPADGSAWTNEGACNALRLELPGLTGRQDRVVRGGSWSLDPGYLRSANRGWFSHDPRGRTVGFRVARTLNP
jgi:formylglycine-generating enzyme required for sulfatase activity